MRTTIFRKISDIEKVPTKHNVGLKQVLLSKDDTDTNIAQIAITELKAGDNVSCHAHDSMEEYFFFIKGSATMVVDRIEYKCEPGTFIAVPCGSSHIMTAITDVTVECIGSATSHKWRYSIE